LARFSSFKHYIAMTSRARKISYSNVGKIQSKSMNVEDVPSHVQELVCNKSKFNASNHAEQLSSNKAA
jgi:hypothetical protein